MIFDEIKAYAWQFAALGLGALLLVQTLRLADASQAEAKAIATLSTERAASEHQARLQSEHYREMEGKHREEIAKIGAATSAAIAAADADAGRARVVAGGLQRDLADYITEHRRAAQARATAGQCQADTTALDLLADLQRRADARAGELAGIADQARARGTGCERAYDAGQALNDAAPAANP